MFGKLMKYDIKALGKIIFPLWGALLILGFVFSLGIRFDLTVASSIAVFSLIAIIGVIAAIFTIGIIIVIQRFWKGLLKQEGYLMFTLPVSVRSLILSKLFSALLISFGTVVVIVLLGFEVMMISPANTFIFDYIKQIHIEMPQVKYAAFSIGYAVILILLAMIANIYHLYAAMTLGQLSNKNRFLFAFASYIILAIIFSVVDYLMLNIIPDLSNLAGGTGSYIFKYILEIIAFHIVTETVLTRRLNLE